MLNRSFRSKSPMMNEKNERYYQALNLEATATPEMIHQAYKDLIRVWEPQRFAHSPRLELMAEEKVKELIEAYQALLPGGYQGAEPGGPVPAPPADPPPAPAPAPAQYEPAYQIDPAYPPAAPVESKPDAPRKAAAPSKRLAPAVAIGAAVLLLGILASVFLTSGSHGPQKISNGPKTGYPADSPEANAPPAPAAPASAPDRPRPAKAKRRPESPAGTLVLENGAELMEPQGPSGAGRFRIANRSGQDAVARISLRSAPEKPLRLVYVKAGTEIGIEDIGTGMYFVSFSMGPVSSKPPRNFVRRFGPFPFTQILSSSRTVSDDYRIILKPRP